MSTPSTHQQSHIEAELAQQQTAPSTFTFSSRSSASTTAAALPQDVNEEEEEDDGPPPLQPAEGIPDTGDAQANRGLPARGP